MKGLFIFFIMIPVFGSFIFTISKAYHHKRYLREINPNKYHEEPTYFSIFHGPNMQYLLPYFKRQKELENIYTERLAKKVELHSALSLICWSVIIAVMIFLFISDL